MKNRRGFIYRHFALHALFTGHQAIARHCLHWHRWQNRWASWSINLVWTWYLSELWGAVRRVHACKQKTLAKCWPGAGPTSATLAPHRARTGHARECQQWLIAAETSIFYSCVPNAYCMAGSLLPCTALPSGHSCLVRCRRRCCICCHCTWSARLSPLWLRWRVVTEPVLFCCHGHRHHAPIWILIDKAKPRLDPGCETGSDWSKQQFRLLEKQRWLSGGPPPGHGWPAPGGALGRELGTDKAGVVAGSGQSFDRAAHCSRGHP